MLAVGATTGPLIGPRRLLDALAARNPDLWRTHEGNANLLLVGPALAVVPGSEHAVRLNPPGEVLRAAAELGLEAGELLRYLPEPRVAVIARVRAASGAEVVVASLHCHNARHPELIVRELTRASEALEGAARGAPMVLAGDLNAPPSHPALAAAAAMGWRAAPPAAGVGIGPDSPEAAELARTGAATRRSRGGRVLRRPDAPGAALGPRPRRGRRQGERISSCRIRSTMRAAATAPQRRARARSRPTQSASGHTSGKASRPKRAIEVIVPLERGTTSTAAE